MTAVETAPTPVHELLARFVHPTHAVLKHPTIVHAYRGDCTESNERRLRATLGEAAYASLHYDTIACDGRVMVILPRCRAAGAVEAPFGFRTLTAEHHWALTEVDEKSPEVVRARPETVQRVPVEIARELFALPGLEFVDVHEVTYWVHGNGPAKRKKKPAPQDVVYFRFTGGMGVVLTVAASGGRTS